MATLGQAMVVPLLASLEVAENQMAAPFMLHEMFDKRQDISAAIIPVGKVDECGVAVPETYADTKAEFGELFLAPAFLVFEAFTIAVFAGCWYGIRQAKYGTYHFLFFGYIAGFLGGQQNMFLKGVGTYFGTAFAGDPTVFADYLVYVFILAMAGLAATQLAYLNRGPGVQADDGAWLGNVLRRVPVYLFRAGDPGHQARQQGRGRWSRDCGVGKVRQQ